MLSFILYLTIFVLGTIFAESDDDRELDLVISYKLNFPIHYYDEDGRLHTIYSLAATERVHSVILVVDLIKLRFVQRVEFRR